METESEINLESWINRKKKQPDLGFVMFLGYRQSNQLLISCRCDDRSHMTLLITSSSQTGELKFD